MEKKKKRKYFRDLWHQVFRGKRQTANRKMSCDHGLAVTFAFEPQEGLPAVSDLRQGFLPQKIVQPRV